MPIRKDGRTDQQAASEVLRKCLIRCYATVSSDYPEYANMALKRPPIILFTCRPLEQFVLSSSTKRPRSSAVGLSS